MTTPKEKPIKLPHRPLKISDVELDALLERANFIAGESPSPEEVGALVDQYSARWLSTIFGRSPAYFYNARKGIMKVDPLAWSFILLVLDKHRSYRITPRRYGPKYRPKETPPEGGETTTETTKEE